MFRLGQLEAIRVDDRLRAGFWPIPRGSLRLEQVDGGRRVVELHLVGVHQHLAVDVSSRAANRLDKGRLAAQEALLVGVENRDQRDLRQVEALAQEVDADEHVVVAEAQLADDLDAVERVDLGGAGSAP